MDRVRPRKYDALKRTLDVAGAFLLLLMLFPLLILIAVAVSICLGSPVLFRQPRPGLGGKVFTLLKFRSMRDIDEGRGLVTDAQRITRFGKALRATSLDELPSLVNVLRGEMSMVGPRPLLVSYLNLYTAQQARRHEVRPGITGLAQVSGRNGLTWEERFRLDVEYVERRSLLLDAQILVRTVKSVLRRDGIAAEGHVTTPMFGGSHD